MNLLLDLPRLPARPALWIVYHTYKLLKSQSGTLKGCGAPGWTMVPPPVRKLDPKNLEAHGGAHPYGGGYQWFQSPGYGATLPPYSPYREWDCVTDEGEGRFLPCEMGGG